MIKKGIKHTYSFSPSSFKYDTAIAKILPSFEKLSDEMLLG